MIHSYDTSPNHHIITKSSPDHHLIITSSSPDHHQIITRSGPVALAAATAVYDRMIYW